MVAILQRLLRWKDGFAITIRITKISMLILSGDLLVYLTSPLQIHLTTPFEVTAISLYSQNSLESISYYKKVFLLSVKSV
jgi:hypothetical protein